MKFEIIEKTKQGLIKNKNVIGEIILHIGLYWSALSFAYNAYKTYRRGYDYLASYVGYKIANYFPIYFEYHPLSKELRETIVATFTSIIFIFLVIYLLYRLGRGGRAGSLSYKRWFLIILSQAVITNIFFSNLGKEMIIILNLALPFFIIFLILCAISIKWLTSVLPFIRYNIIMKLPGFINKYNIYFVILIICYFVLTIWLSYASMPSHQWLLVFGMVMLFITTYFLIVKIFKNNFAKKAVILFSYAIVASVIFYPTAKNIFRSDYWFIANLFSQTEMSLDGIKQIAFFEMFGDIRFQPLAHLLMFMRHLILGNESILYNVLNIALHTAVGFALFFVLFKLLKDIQYSFIIGMLFVVLPSQFDTVVWTYHIYIIVGTLTVLIEILLAYKYTETGRHVYLFVAILFSIFSILLYEPFIFATATLFLIVSGFYLFHENTIPKNRFVAATIGVTISYLFYLSITVYGLNAWADHSSKMAFKDILTILRIGETIKAVFINLYKSTFLKNIGLILDVKIQDIVYLYLPQGILTNIATLPKMILGLFIISLFRVRRDNSYLVLPFVVLAASYLFIIYLGRLLTNDLSYGTSQPRYQYFPNALLLIATGILLWPMYKKIKIRAIINVSLMVIFIWNAQSVLYSNNKVAFAMKSMDAHYYRIKDYFSFHPKAKLFLNFLPNTYEKFSLGSDIALRILFKDRITISLKEATHIYDGSSFKENRMNRAGMPSPYLKEFSIEWMYMHPSHILRKREIVIIGSDKTYPKISLLPEFVKIEMVDANTGKTDVYKIKYSYYSKDESDSSLKRWVSMVIEKDDKELNFIYNGILQSKIKLNSTHRGWDKDGANILGEYYKGSKEPVYIGRLFVQADGAKYSCRSYQVGDKIDVDIKKPW